ncbi:MAG: hypothetical protein QGG36_33320, partial [Pirellulaceae bacterium]|nr:hypothetical protein [Pirellulaceae bacterium]
MTILRLDHISVHGMPAGVELDQMVEIGGRRLQPLKVAPQSSLPLPVAFDEAGERLAGLPRCFYEPDGSFVWVGDGWQLDGVLYDRGGELDYVELKGECSSSALDHLLDMLGREERRPMFQVMRFGVFLTE